jgi:hypothetical protein
MNKHQDVDESVTKPIIQSARMKQSGKFRIDPLEQVMVSTALVFVDIIKKYEESMNKYIKFIFIIETIAVYAAIVMNFFLYLMIWRPYLNNLNNNIWRTKGMLSMIPMKAIQRNPALEKDIIDGDLIQAVK